MIQTSKICLVPCIIPVGGPAIICGGRICGGATAARPTGAISVKQMQNH